METKKIILKLRTERGMSQDELADKIMVTRQAVSRWENGDTVPNTDTLKLFFGTTLIISKKPGNTGISRDIRTEFTTDLLLSD